MKHDNLHNKLYKLAIAMHKVNGKGVKRNFELLLSTMPIRTKAARRQ
jgi:hypothetical protein